MGTRPCECRMTEALVEIFGDPDSNVSDFSDENDWYEPSSSEESPQQDNFEEDDGKESSIEECEPQPNAQPWSKRRT